MHKVQAYLSERFSKTRWPYHGINQMLYDLRDKATKDELRDEVRELRKSGVVDIVSGLNGWMIYIKDETKF